jgi:hypothetical protein
MKRDPDSAKRREDALIAAALKELAERKSAPARPPQRAPASPTAPLKGATVAGRDRPAAQPRKPAPRAPTTPIDHPTVDGWNHPSALDAAPKVKIAAEEKWTRIAAAMEAEQQESRRARDRMRLLGRRFAIGAAVIIFLLVISVLHR